MEVEICESKLFVKIADILLFIFDFNMKVKYRYLNSISSIFLSVFIFVFEKNREISKIIHICEEKIFDKTIENLFLSLITNDLNFNNIP